MNETDHGDRPGRPGEPADPLGRRQFLRGLAGAGALAGAGGLLAACSSGSPAPAAKQPGGNGGQEAGRRPEGGPHRRLGLGHARPAQGAHLSRHGPRAVALPAAAAAEHPGAVRVRAGRGDQPARVDVAVGDPAPARHHLPRRQAAHRRRRHLHAQADHHREADRRDAARADRREGPEEARQAHRPGADDQPLRQLPRPAGLLVLPVHRAGRLQPGQAERHRAVQVPELHAGPAQRLRQEPQLLEVGPAVRRLGDDHRFQRQHLAAERPDHRRHPRRGRPRGPADRGAEVGRRGADRHVAHRRDHAVHDAGRPGAVQRRQRPAGDAAAGGPPAADRLRAGRVRDRRLRRLLPLRPQLRHLAAPGAGHRARRSPC